MLRSKRILATASVATIFSACWLSTCASQVPGQTQATQTQSNQATSPAAGAAKDTKAAIVAVVNGASITRIELAKQCLDRYGETVLESLVNKHLILEACRAQGVSINRSDIEQEIEAIATRFSLPKERWLQMLQDERNISAEQYRRDIIWPTLALKHLAKDELKVSDAELRKEYESEYGEKVQVRMIALGTKEQADEILKQAQAKPDQFGNLAKQHSKDPNSAAARGLIPPVRKHIGDPAVEQACFALEVGEISPVVTVAGQHLIFMCEKQLPAAHISPQYQRAAYDRLRERLTDRKMREASSTIFGRLQQTASVVNVFNDEEKRKANPGVAAIINGKQIPIATLGEECIERHGIDVLESEINYRLLKQALAQKKMSVARAELNEEVGRAAESYGYVTEDQKPDVKRWLKEMTDQEGLKVETYVRDAVWPSVALKKLVKSEVSVTDEDLRRGFEANYGPRVEVLACVLSNQRTAQEVWNMARSNATATFFGELSSRYSIEPVSRANMGEVPPIRRFSGQPKVEDEAFKLTDDNRLSAIIAMADKYIIMFYKGRTEPVVTKLEEVQGELTKDIREKKLRMAMAREFDRLKQVAQIDNYLLRTSQSGGGTPKLTTRPRSGGTPVIPASSRK